MGTYMIIIYIFHMIIINIDKFFVKFKLLGRLKMYILKLLTRHDYLKYVQ